MRKTIVAINITLDGFCDHTAGIVDDQLLEHYESVLSTTDTSIMGRKTYQLMENYWPEVAKNRTGTEAEIKFAERIDELRKIVVSRTLANVAWQNTRIIHDNIIEEVKRLKLEDGKNILIGGPSIISYLTNADLIDEFNFVIHPIVLGNGILLFSNLSKQVDLELIDTRRFDSGVISTNYRVRKN